MPLLDSLKRWFEATLLTLSGKSDTSIAIQYALNPWAALVYYCSDGRVEIDWTCPCMTRHAAALAYLTVGSGGSPAVVALRAQSANSLS